MKFISSLSLILLLVSCSQKSHIDPFFSSEPLMSNNGNVSLKVTVPLSDSSLTPYAEDPMQSELPIIGDIVEQFKFVFFNLGVTLGFGKKHIQLRTEIPNLNFKELEGIYVRDVFFVMDNRVCEKATDEDCHSSKFYVQPDLPDKKIKIMKKPSFKFLDKILINVSTSQSEASLDKSLQTKVFDVKSDDFFNHFSGLTESATSKNIGSYARSNFSDVKYAEQMSRMFYVETNNPSELKKYLLGSSDYEPYVQKVIKNSKMIIVESKTSAAKLIKFIKHDPNMNQYELGKIRTCDNYRCLKIDLADVNLLDLIKDKNTLDLNVYLDIFSVPRKAFWLKGFVDLEVKLNISI